MDNEIFDIVIIGAGPAGLFAQFYAGLRELKTALIEATPQIGGQITALYPEKTILDVAGFLGISGRDLVSRLKLQTDLVDSKTFLNSEVTNLKKSSNQFEIEINHHASFLAKSVIIASGNGSFSPRKINVPGSSEAEQSGLLTYLLPGLSEVSDKDFAVVGGGNTAVDYAAELIDHNSRVSLIHRRDNFHALESSITKLENSSETTFLTPMKITGLNPKKEKLEIELQSVTDGVVRKISVDRLIGGFGFTASSKTVNQWEDLPEQFDQGFLTDVAQMTSIPGVFAVGDASSYQGKSDLIATAFGEVPTAINQAVNYFDPDRGGPQHSTSLNKREVFKHD
ncbi:NAD(P)/FAD-dependent oxidoreductase [Oenococcus sp. UCMA 16435]|nr:NAD(P)/FAD-dependent oxidoreductase [Oenococcus sp. UCMA 16435]MDI4584414.1 SidA/IucD/PvdA family monooxygenase [Oenococcus sp. UCMA 14587]